MKKPLFKTHFFLITCLSCIPCLHVLTNKSSTIEHLQTKEFEIPPTEDLMQEHGILNRVLLIYDEIIKRIDNNIEFPLSALERAIDIIKSFIQDHHEKLEENYIFPLFEKNKKELQLVKTLRKQHAKGREITAQLKDIISEKKSLRSKDKIKIKRLLQKFITMYRPHEARENTVLFPQVRSFVSEEDFKELGELFEKLEEKKFGEHGFESILNKVVSIEKTLDIYDLEKFTPKIK